MSELEIREGTSADLPAVTALHSQVFGSDRTAEFSEWLAEKNPAGEMITILAEQDGTLAAAYSLQPVWMRRGQDRVLGAQSLDTMTHPEFRGRGLFVRTALAAMDVAKSRGVELLYGFPNPSSYVGFVGKLEWTDIGHLQRWRRSLGGASIGWRSVRRRVVAAALPYGSRSSCDVVASTPSGPVLEEVEQLLRHEERIRVERSSGSLEWRTHRSSQRGYRWAVDHSPGGALEGVGAWGVNPETGEANVALLVAAHAESRRRVLATLLRDAYAAGVGGISYSTSPDEQGGYLGKAGFRETPGLPIIVKSLVSDDDERLFDLSSWYLSGLDLDTV